MENLAVCIHGHFYQPPRENPWTDKIEVQKSAEPFLNWNGRITHECYEPNIMARILDNDDNLIKKVNNYSKISFNFGPTLLTWLEAHAPDVYSEILQADIISSNEHSGCGSAMAQGYNHIIMPLANKNDKDTQVKWGIADFTHRFGRKPDGMWLPETAVDLETLETLAENGITFTLLAPHQADKFKKRGSDEWISTADEEIDTSRSYLQKLPSGKEIILFFYNGSVSQGVAFEGLLKSGAAFTERILGSYDNDKEGIQLLHIATDGESYGHHHTFGEMALAFTVEHIEKYENACLTNYSEFLKHNQTEFEVQIHEETSWSCAHGIERWREDCGCNSGELPEGWNQSWRIPLRESLDWLRDSLNPVFDNEGSKLLNNTIQARNEYISVILKPTKENFDAFLGAHTKDNISREERIKTVQLLEMSRNLMLMYTSCGWFFDDISGIETKQILSYAARSIELAGKFTDTNLEEEFIKRLHSAKSNEENLQDGGQIYKDFIHPLITPLEESLTSVLLKII